MCLKWNYHCTFVMLVCMLMPIVCQAGKVQSVKGDSTSNAGNLIPNGDFSEGKPGQIPTGWEREGGPESETSVFSRISYDEKPALLVRAPAEAGLVSTLKTTVPVTRGKTYLFSVYFKITGGLNPQQHLLFQCYGPGNSDGIFTFSRKPGGWIEGSRKISFPGEGKATATIRILHRFGATGEAIIRNISLLETTPDPPRWVRIAGTSGVTHHDDLPDIVSRAASEKVDLLLLPEYLSGGKLVVEEPHGKSEKLIAQLAKKHKMYIAGGIVRRDNDRSRVYNTTVLFDRNGVMVAMYDKIHPYSPEVNEQGISPGEEVVVAQTDFGKVGFMTCYDSWFSDVAELNALKGAEVILFPNAGYYRSIIPARAADNGVRIISSSLGNRGGIWDTAGRDILDPDQDSTVSAQPGNTFHNIVVTKVGKVELIIATLDLNYSPYPHYNGGSMYSAPAGQRNRRDQIYYLGNDIIKERDRWWDE